MEFAFDQIAIDLCFLTQKCFFKLKKIVLSRKANFKQKVSFLCYLKIMSYVYNRITVFVLLPWNLKIFIPNPFYTY